MYVNNSRRTKINIELDNGLWVFDDMSATGKTRLYKELKKHLIYDGDVVSFSYNDFLLGVDLRDLVSKHSDCKVLLIDRYDMMYGKYTDIINEYADKSIVLIDCKRPLTFTDKDDVCFITMTEDTITVGE